MRVLSTWRFGLNANQAAWDVLRSGGSALDAVVDGVAVAERDPEVRSVGHGGYPNAEGIVEVDAAVVDGRSLSYGAVAGLRNVPVAASVARRVMEKTDHVLLVGEGFPEQDLLTEHGRRAWEDWKAGRDGPPRDTHDTIGQLALDGAGNLAAACTTSGLAFKLPGRVGDSPLIGCGLYVRRQPGRGGGRHRAGRGDRPDLRPLRDRPPRARGRSPPGSL